MINEMSGLMRLLEEIKHKDTYGSTTTKKFKEDLIKILTYQSFEGDILEVGAHTGETTLVLAKAAESLNKKVYAFEHNSNRIEEAKKLINSYNVTNVEFIKKDVYKESWGIKNVGLVFIDCVHKKDYFKKDIENTRKIINDDGIIIAHDYGLVTREGDGIKPHIEEAKDLEIVSYIGEKDSWNDLGSGSVIDWEAVQLKLI